MSDRKNNILAYPAINAQSMGASITGAITSTQYLDDIGIQFTWSGSPVGLLSIEISADYARDINGNVTNTGHWVPITFSYWNGSSLVTGTTVPTSVGSPVYFDLALLSAPWIRPVYTRTSGTGTLTATITAKGL